MPYPYQALCFIVESTRWSERWICCKRHQLEACRLRGFNRSLSRRTPASVLCLLSRSHICVIDILCGVDCSCAAVPPAHSIDEHRQPTDLLFLHYSFEAGDNLSHMTFLAYVRR